MKPIYRVISYIFNYLVSLTYLNVDPTSRCYWLSATLRDFRLSPWIRLELRSSGLMSSELVIPYRWQSIGPVFKGQESKKNPIFELDPFWIIDKELPLLAT